MALLRVESTQTRHNPIDMLEELGSVIEWRHERSADEEMVVEFRGQWCEYRMFFVWQEDLGALYFSCLFDMKIPAGKLGHFDLSSEEMSPMYRHTVLLRGTSGIVAEQLEDLLETAIGECERFYPAFQFALWGGKKPHEAMEAAMLETVGEA